MVVLDCCIVDEYLLEDAEDTLKVSLVEARGSSAYRLQFLVDPDEWEICSKTCEASLFVRYADRTKESISISEADSETMERINQSINATNKSDTADA